MYRWWLAVAGGSHIPKAGWLVQPVETTQTNAFDGCYLVVADANANGLAVPAGRNNSPQTNMLAVAAGGTIVHEIHVA